MPSEVLKNALFVACPTRRGTDQMNNRVATSLVLILIALLLIALVAQVWKQQIRGLVQDEHLRDFPQRAPYSLPGHVQGLGQHTRFADHTQEIRVRHPARQDVHMDVSSNAGSRGSSDIHADINAV